MRFAFASCALLAATLALACGDDDPAAPIAPPLENADAGSPVDDDRPLVPANKIDLLFVVDNSASMGDKTSVLATSMGPFIRAVTSAVRDVHVGVVTTSLGTPGGDVCDNTPVKNGLAHLQRTGVGGQAVAGAENGVLAFNDGNVDSFVAAAQSLVRGVGETGCGFEAQLESAYRFLVQPDPWASVRVGPFGLATLDGTDTQILAERKAFLRSDSAVVVVLLTDEDDAFADPLSLEGQGWSFAMRAFPGSNIARGGGVAQGKTAPRGTSICATNPTSADCDSCGRQLACDDAKPECQLLKQDANCKTSGATNQSGDGYNGFYGPTDDDLNVRFHRLKARFGVDPQFPIARYVDGFTKSLVPDRNGEHPTKPDSNPPVIEPYAGKAECTNPLFAAELPDSPSQELCKLTRGNRSRELVLFTVLGGVPQQLIGGDLPDWTRVVGVNPESYDYSGQDPHMVASITPRQGLTREASNDDNGTDPIHGRDWNTDKRDLQYACTFTLPSPRTCAANDTACDCNPSRTTNPPLCNGGQQVKAKAYPTLRPLQVVRALGARGVVGSICATSYTSTLEALTDKLSTRLAK